MNGLTAVSLFAGIGGIDRALELAGFKVTAAVEIDPDCRGVLRRHFPDTAIFNDVTEVTGDQLRAAGFVPRRGILSGGFPCQGLSVAGLRKGLADARSGLFWHVMRLADELRPRWLLLENVPGLLSSVCPCTGDGTCVAGRRTVACGEWRSDRDTREWFPYVPHNVAGGACPGGCMAAHGGAMGAVLGALGERGYGFAYRVLDAQFFGVPQRRRRVFIAGCLGDRAAPVQVLLEPEGGGGDHAAGTQARARVAGTLAASAGGGGLGGAGQSANAITSRLVETAPTLTAAWGTNHGAPGHGGKDDAVLAVTAATLQGGGRRGYRIDAEGAAGGQLIPAIALPLVSGGNDRHDESQMTYITHAITAREGKGPDSDATNGFIAVPVAWRGRGMEAGEENIANAIRSGGDGHTGDQMGYVMSLAVAGDFSASEGVAQAVRAAHGQPGNVGDAQAVRRLTPLECERLQGFPDRWTTHRADGAGQSDSTRYRQLGNSVAVPCVAWITRRIAALEVASEARGAA